MVCVLVLSADCGGRDPDGTVSVPTSVPTVDPTPAPTPPPIEGHFTVDVALLDNYGEGPYTFSPAEFRFKVGDVVIFSLTSESVYHTFTIDNTSLDVDVEAGEVTYVSNAFDEPGTYSLLCIVHELNGMVGTITVTKE